MGTQGKHSARKPAAWRRPAALVAACAASVVVIAAHVAVSHSAGPRAAGQDWPGTTRAHGGTGNAANLTVETGWQPGLPAQAAAPQQVQGPLALTARDHSLCPPAATACVDLTRRLSWLQSGGKLTYGPVRIEPGPPGSAHATPRGTFSVMWRGGPNARSNIYNELMPWAVIFTSSGVAFHAGSLTVPSHGCAHMTMANAHYYNEHLALGDEVVVF
jgi:L,D-transpeptidase catalytic domain